MACDTQHYNRANSQQPWSTQLRLRTFAASLSALVLVCARRACYGEENRDGDAVRSGAVATAPVDEQNARTFAGALPILVLIGAGRAGWKGGGGQTGISNVFGVGIHKGRAALGSPLHPVWPVWSW